MKKTIRKILSLLLVVVIIVASIPLTGNNQMAKIISDLFINAKAVAYTYTVNYYLNENDMYASYPVVCGEEVPIPESPSKEGYSFVGWSENIPSIMPDRNLSFFALWVELDSSCPFVAGDGTESNPYQVSTPEQLNAVRYDLSAHYTQTTDIDMSSWDNWIPIGIGDSLNGIIPPADPPKAEYQPFIGSYNGNNFCIKNLYINNYAVSFVSDCYGLFSAIDKGTVKNVKMIDFEFIINKSSTDYAQISQDYRATYAVYVGGIAGESIDSTIKNCSVGGNINVSYCEDVFVGGICGSGSAMSSVSDVDVKVNSVTTVYGGGIVGTTPTINTELSGCTNYGNIEASADGFAYIGGISGEYGLVSNCVNFGNVFGEIISPSAGHSSFAGTCNVGGIVGATSSSYIKNSINYGDISAYLDCKDISNYDNTYSIAYAGGIVGYCGYYGSGSVNNCYNLAQKINCTKVTNSGTTTDGNTGRISGYSIENTNCFSVLSTTLNEKTLSSADSTSNNGHDLTKEDLLKKEIYIDFDFEYTWQISESVGGAILKFSHTDDSEPENEKGVNIPEDIAFIEKDEHYLFSAYDIDGNDITDKVSWNSTTSVDCTGEVKITNNGDVQGVMEGLTNVHVSYWNMDTLENLGSDSCYVFVGDPNEIKYTSVSDSIYYYGENAFYSDAGQFSDSVDIYIALENAIHEQIEFLTEYSKYDDELETLAINGYTLTASVSGSNLSFDKNEYINNYISAVDADIPIAKAVDELLTLYPYNLDVSSEDKTFTVSIKIESEDFNTITDSFTFKISSLEDKEINEHISFTNSNGVYKAMRDNDFATGMSDLKNDSQYIWSKYSTLDFENYHEVLMADILVQLMETQLVGNISLLPVLKEWNSNYNTILGSVSTIVEDSYAGSMEITDNLIDKVIKKSKYTTEGMDVHDEVRDLVVLKLRDKVSIDKINSAFAALDKTGQCLDLFDMGVNITNDIANWVDCVSIMNSYQNMNEEFKNVIQKVYDCIPDSDWQVKDAVYHYVKLDTTAGYSQEVIESVIELSKDITLEVFNSVFKKQFISMFTNAIGSITLKSGALLSSTTAFSTISTGLGAISTGATLGLCISDILCNNSGQAEEMGKVVAASQLAPYVIQTLKYYEWALKNYKDESYLKHFEVAFNLNKALQIYSIEHTYKGLEIQANSIIIKLFSRRDYPGAMAELASLKTSHINCNCCEDVYTGVIKTKTIAIKCPVDVYIYDENGKEVVRIINDVAVYVENGINVFINGREKYVTVPANQEYSIKIIATDEGTMDYWVIEHNENSQYGRIVKNTNIALSKDQVFTGGICEEFNVNEYSYALNSDGDTIKPTGSVDVSVEVGGKCGDNLEWTFDELTGELLISGTGEMYDYECYKTPWKKYDVTSVVISDGVTSIGENAFYDFDSIKSITIGESVAKIGEYSFYCCKNNASINVDINNKYYSNDSYGVLYNKNKTELVQYPIGNTRSFFAIPSSVVVIQKVAFVNSKNLTDVTIPNGVAIIGERAFLGCENLLNIAIPKSVTTITNNAFNCCESLTSVTIHKNVDIVEYGAFYCCDNITDVYFVGSEEEWKKLEIQDYNDPLINSTIHYNINIVKSVDIGDISMNYKDSAIVAPAIVADERVNYTVTYSSSNPNVATVDENGNIVTKQRGSTIITCTVIDEYGNEVSDTCTLEVTFSILQWIIWILMLGFIWY